VRDASAVPAQLPPAAAGFTGRAVHLERLDAMLAARDESSAIGVAALWGPGGVGKTALAVQWGHLRRRDFPDGQLYLDLRGWSAHPPLRASEAIARLLRALGVPYDQIPSHVEEATALYRSRLSGRRMLVLLDNAADAEQVRPLVPGEPGCAVLVTGRGRLTGLTVTPGADHLELAMLTAAESAELVGRLIGAERARSEPEAVAELGRLCGGLPLAVRIAAASLDAQRYTAVAAYVDELRDGDRLGMLTIEGDESVSVSATFTLSYRRLPEASRRALRLLSLHPGPDFSIALAAAVTNGLDEYVGILAGAGFVEPRGAGRFALYSLVRRFAAERSNVDDRPEVQEQAMRRLLDWYLQETAKTNTAAWFDAELDNILALIGEAWRSGRHEYVWRLPAVAWCHYQSAIVSAEWIEIHSRAAGAASLCGDRAAQAAAIRDEGGFCYSLGRHEESAAKLTEAAGIYDAIGDRPGWAGAMALLGRTLYAQGRFEDSLACLRRADKATRDDGPSAARAETLRCLGMVLRDTGEHDAAAQAYEKALRIYRCLGDERGQAAALNNLGNVMRRLGKLSDARAAYEQVLERCRRLGDRRGESNARNNLGLVCRELGEHAEAEEHLRAALAGFQAASAPGGMAAALNNLALVKRDRAAGPAGIDQAIDHHRQALELCLAVGDRGRECEVRNDLGDSQRLAGDLASAQGQYAQAHAVSKKIGYPLQQALAEQGLGHVRLALGDQAAAHDHWQRALQLFTELNVPEAEALSRRLETFG